MNGANWPGILALALALILPLAASRNDRGGVLGVTDASQPTLRLLSPVDPAKFVGIGVGERREEDCELIAAEAADDALLAHSVNRRND